MSARLTIAIRIADSENAILQRVEAFDHDDATNKKEWDMRAHIGIDPILLALSMELALKAWFVFDYDTREVKKSHSLSKLFAVLKLESQEKLDSEFRRSISPQHPNLFSIDYGIIDVLAHHESAFVDWRYTHEIKDPISVHTSTFVATLKMILAEFSKRYRTEKFCRFGRLSKLLAEL